MINGDDLLRQTIESVLGTNKGEWPLNEEEGITFSNVLGKNIEEDIVKSEVQQGLLQVDETFTLTSFQLTRESNRKYKVIATAQREAGSEVTVETTYG